jgi:hypothetical protein
MPRNTIPAFPLLLITSKISGSMLKASLAKAYESVNLATIRDALKRIPV